MRVIFHLYGTQPLSVLLLFSSNTVHQRPTITTQKTGASRHWREFLRRNVLDGISWDIFCFAKRDWKEWRSMAPGLSRNQERLKWFAIELLWDRFIRQWVPWLSRLVPWTLKIPPHSPSFPSFPDIPLVHSCTFLHIPPFSTFPHIPLHSPFPIVVARIWCVVPKFCSQRYNTQIISFLYVVFDPSIDSYVGEVLYQDMLHIRN